MLVNIEFVRAILADFTRIFGRTTDEMLAGHDRLRICEFRIIGRAQVIRLTNGPHHIFIHLQLLEAALAGCSESLIYCGPHTSRLKWSLSCAATRIIHTALDEIGAGLHAKRVAIGFRGGIKHCFHLLFLDLERPSAD